MAISQRFDEPERPISDDYETEDLLKMGGLFLILFSAIVGLPVVFFLPTGCSVVGGFMLVGFALLFLIGVGTYLSGVIMKKRKQKY